ncbi:hypothetical protein ACN6LC_007453 [Streptomyces violaceoruber]|uniref:hypothetical protein n=1 Tax=Streptomyces TaxID=1883 RepID=UPI001E32ACD8|nr:MULTISPECIES: hypothetical protein [Streptomyces]
MPTSSLAVHHVTTGVRTTPAIRGRLRRTPRPGPGLGLLHGLARGDDGVTGTPFVTRETDVSVRQQPTTDSARVARPPGPTSVRVACQVHGGLVEYDGYSNDAWSHLPDHGGYVSSIFIDVDDARPPGAPTC